ncbi:MAG: arginine--tRNA ligase [Candidatus Aenigmatarchaeota archaeon]
MIIMNPLQKFYGECEEIAGKHASLLEKPKHFGDLALPCFSLAKEFRRNPIEIASELASVFSESTGGLVKEVRAIGPYVNFYINEKEFGKLVLKQVLKEKKKYGSAKNKGKIMVEYAHPNTHKLFHIGHLRNIITGEALSRILSFSGFKVIRANYQGDIGMHIAKCMWGIKKLGMKKFKTIDDKIKFLGKAYAIGSGSFESDENAKKEITVLNEMMYKKDKKIMKLWKETRQWSLAYFDKIYKRVYTKFDKLYFESQVFDSGLKIAKILVKKGILENSEGAIIFNGEKYGLDKRVFVNQLGFPTYEAKELGLAEKEFSDNKPDKAIHLTGPEQASFFNVTIKVEELMNPKKFTGKQKHLIYGWVKLKEGKMSSRLGNVVEGEWLLNELKKNVLEKYVNEKKLSLKKKDELAESIAISAAKYYFLRHGMPIEISFDIDEAVSLEGDTGPYLQYTYARAGSVLRKSKKKPVIGELDDEETAIIKKIAEFPDIITKTVNELKPNLLANYLSELCLLFNEYYQNIRIIESAKEAERLALVQSLKQVMENGLELLGIKTIEKM